MSDDLAAPHLLPVEAGNVLRRLAMRSEISEDVAALAHADFVDLRVALFPYTLDARLTQAPGPRCGFRLPP